MSISTKEASNDESLIVGATALILSASAASAQAVYVTPGYAAPAYMAPAPVYVAPAPVYVAPPAVVQRYYTVPRAAVTVSTPIYDYAPGYADTVTIAEPDW